MPISLVCGKCGKALKAPDSLLGKKVRCPACQNPIAIPAAAPAVAPAPARPRPTAPAPRRQEPPPGEFGIAPAHEIAPPPVPLAVRNAIADAQAREERNPEFAVPGAAPGKNKLAAKSHEPLAPPKHNYRYFVFLLALLPLCWMLIAPSLETAEDEVAQSTEAAAEDGASEGSASEDEIAPESDIPLPEGITFDENGEPEIDVDSLPELLDVLLESEPLPGAHLTRGSWMHWLYAILAAAIFLGLMLVCLPIGNATPQQLILIGLVTSTGGLVFLIGLQYLGEFAWRMPLIGNPAILIFVVIFRLIGFAYFAASMSDGPFALLFLGFTFGVGLCEELTKAMPVLFRGRDGQESDWRGAGARGFASGVGFGVAEGIMYARDFYNGVEPFSMYLVRFASCVTLHAVWTYAVGIMIWRYRQELSEEEDWRYLAFTLLKVLAVPMTLHGLYDTALTKEMPLLALVTALASFGWLALQIELVMRRERDFYDELNRRRARQGLA